MQADQTQYVTQPPQVIYIQGRPTSTFGSGDGTSGRFAPQLSLLQAGRCSTALIWLAVIMIIGQIIETIGFYAAIFDEYALCSQSTVECSLVKYAGYWSGCLVIIAAIVMKISMSGMNDLKFLVICGATLVAITFSAVVLGESADAVSRLSSVLDFALVYQVLMAGEAIMLIGGIGGLIAALALAIYLIVAVVQGIKKPQ